MYYILFFISSHPHYISQTTTMLIYKHIGNKIFVIYIYIYIFFFLSHPHYISQKTTMLIYKYVENDFKKNISALPHHISKITIMLICKLINRCLMYFKCMLMLIFLLNICVLFVLISSVVAGMFIKNIYFCWCMFEVLQFPE